MLPKCIWHLRGKNQDGPNVVILGGTHGNELAALEVVRRLLKRCDLLLRPADVYQQDSVIGNIFIGFGNPEAIVRNTRSASEGRDLNRSFSAKDLDSKPRLNERLDLQRARELTPLLRETDYLFDIHSTSSPSEPAVCFGKVTDRHCKLLPMIPVKYVVTDPDLLYTKDVGLDELGTSDFFVNEHGGSNWSKRKFGRKQGLAICYETGHFTDMDKVDQILYTITTILKSLHVITEDLAELLTQNLALPAKVPEQIVCAIAECITAQHEKFSFSQGLDQGWQEVKRGQKIGKYADGQIVIAPRGGLLLFQRATVNIKKGNNLFCIARHIKN